MTAPPLETVQLGKKSVQVCSECACEPPEHAYYCRGADQFTRERILREMLALEDRMLAVTSLRQWCLSLAKADGVLAAIALRKEHSLLRGYFWGWGDRLIGDQKYTPQGMPAIRALRDELRALRKAEERKQDTRPPWKRNPRAA